jgi:nucleoside-diphosphate-sugar epimerase
MKALVTGATGFIGRHLLRKLSQEGWEVAYLCRNPPELVGGEGYVIPDHHEELSALLRKIKPDVVFHLATCFRAEHTPQDIPQLLAANIELGVRLAEAMTAAGVLALLNVGTIWQNFDARPFSPVSLYAATKQAMADLLQYYSEVRGLKVITLKLGDTYGPHDTRRKVVELLIEAAQKGTPLEMSPGEQLVDLVHVEDALSAMLLAARILANSNQSQVFETYAVTSGNPLSLQELAARIEKVVGRKLQITWGVRPYRKREMFRSFVVDAPLPGWRPQYDLSAGISQLLAP